MMLTAPFLARLPVAIVRIVGFIARLSRERGHNTVCFFTRTLAVVTRTVNFVVRFSRELWLLMVSVLARTPLDLVRLSFLVNIVGFLVKYSSFLTRIGILAKIIVSSFVACFVTPCPSFLAKESSFLAK